MTLQCEYCGQEFQCSPSRYENSKHHCCSRKCIAELRKQSNLNCVCEICGIKIHRKPSQLRKNEHCFCSYACKNKYESDNRRGTNNHQYGLRGSLNASWQGGRRISSYGYILVWDDKHPFAHVGGYCFEHRLVAEKYLLDETNSIEIDGKKYLSPEYIVHHIDGNRQNNDVSNLQVIKKDEHSKLHGKLQIRDRDNLGRFI